MSAPRTISARCRPSKNVGALGSAMIGQLYSELDRFLDHAGLMDQDAPAPRPTKPFKDPAKLPVVENLEMRSRRAQLSWIAKFRNICNDKDHAEAQAYNPVVRERRVAPVRSTDVWDRDYQAERENHARWLERERAENAQRRLLKALG